MEYLFLRMLASRNPYVDILIGFRSRVGAKKHEIRNNLFYIFGTRTIRNIIVGYGNA